MELRALGGIVTVCFSKNWKVFRAEVWNGWDDRSIGQRSSFLDRLAVERQAAELRRLSLADELTGLANRPHAKQKLEEEWHRGMRSGQALYRGKQQGRNQ